ncbi:MAG: sugar phosphate isomerase/epimerase family protein, partial [Verrucomicrobiales bacterium]
MTDPPKDIRSPSGRGRSRRGFLGDATAAGLACGFPPALLTIGRSTANAAEPGHLASNRPLSVKIGLQKAGWGDTPLPEFLAAAAELGYAGVELAPRWLEKEGYPLDRIDRILAKSKAALAPAAFVGGREERGPGAREAFLAVARRHARWIKSHGGNYLIYSTVPRLSAKEGQGNFESFDALADAVLEEGCVPLYHNHFKDSHELSKRYLEEDLEQLDWSRWKLCVDTGHLVLALADPVKFVAQWAGNIRWLHCKDVKSGDIDALRSVRWSDNFTVLGSGVVDFPAILRGLADARYQNWLIIEQDNTPDPVATSRRSIKY